jgi:hypothetical protein
MAVKIVPKFTRADIQAVFLDRKRRIDEAIILTLKRTGEQFVKNARDDGGYTDRTGNLRSSIGYIIMKDGQKLSEDFRTVKGGKEGVAAAKRVIDESVSQFRSGYVLIGVAGMDYAAAVESRGYDVITASSTTAEIALAKAITRIASKIPRMR